MLKHFHFIIPAIIALSAASFPAFAQGELTPQYDDSSAVYADPAQSDDASIAPDESNNIQYPQEYFEDSTNNIQYPQEYFEDDPYSSAYDSIYDNSETDEYPAQPDESILEIPDIPAQSDPITNEEPPKKEKRERYHKAKYFLQFGSSASFRFDTFIGVSSESYTNIFGGINGKLRFGLLGEDFSWGIEQTFGHIWGLHIDSGSKNMTRYDASTYIDMSIFYRKSRHMDIVYTLGAGFLYNLPHTGETLAYGDYLAVDEFGTNLAVGFKLSVMLLFKITRNFGIGLDLTYHIGLDIGSYLEGEFADRNGDYENDDKLLVEILQPGVICHVQF